MSCLLGCTVLTAVGVAARSSSETIVITVESAATGDGSDATVTQFDQEALSGMPRLRVRAEDHGTPAEWEGVPLIEILKRARVPTGEALRGRHLQLYVRIGALDGYAAVYALAKLDPRFNDDPVILADRRDGRPLSEHEGPYRVIAKGDSRAGRWVRQVDSIAVMRAARSAD